MKHLMQIRYFEKSHVFFFNRDEGIVTVAKKLRYIRDYVVKPRLKRISREAMEASLPVVRPLWMSNPSDEVATIPFNSIQFICFISHRSLQMYCFTKSSLSLINLTIHNFYIVIAMITSKKKEPLTQTNG